MHHLLKTKLLSENNLLDELSDQNAILKINWAGFNKQQLSSLQLKHIQALIMRKWTDLGALEMVQSCQSKASPFASIISRRRLVEQQHLFLLLEYLQRFFPTCVPNEAELEKIVSPRVHPVSLESLVRYLQAGLHWNYWFQCAASWHSEPVIRQLLAQFGSGESEFTRDCLQLMKVAIDVYDDDAKIAFSKAGAELVSSGRISLWSLTEPDDWLATLQHQGGENWLDYQAGFDQKWSDLVSTALLSHLSRLLGQSLSSARELLSYQKALIASSYNQAGFY